jgi:hypothetical protein
LARECEDKALFINMSVDYVFSVFEASLVFNETLYVDIDLIDAIHRFQKKKMGEENFDFVFRLFTFL